MLSMEQNWADYGRDLAEIIGSFGGVPNTIDGIYYRTIANCYGLAKDGTGHGQNRDRLEAFYTRWNKPIPS